MDKIRKTSGKRTLSASEKEEKGKGRRTKTKKRLYEGYCSDNKRLASPRSQEDSCSSDESLAYEPKKQKKIPRLPTLELSKSSSNHPELTPKPSKCPKPICESSPNTVTQNVSRVEKCPCPRKQHNCSFDENGNVSLAAIGKTLCAISRTLTLHTGKFNYLKEESEELKHMLLSLKDHPRTDLPCEATNVEKMMEFFPVNSMEKIKEIDSKLEDNEFFSTCVAYFASSSEKGSENRTVTSILCRMMTLDLAQNFTFKGIQRKDHKEKKESFNSLQLSKVLLAALQRCWPKADIRRRLPRLQAGLLRPDQRFKDCKKIAGNEVLAG